MITWIMLPNAATDAAPIQFEYGGVITSADPSTGVAPGTRFSGTIAYDPAVKVPYMVYEGFSEYLYGDAAHFSGAIADGSRLTLQIGARTVLANPGGVEVAVSEIEYPGQPGYGATPSTNVNISNGDIGGSPLRVVVDLMNPNRAVFGSLDPPKALNLPDFPRATLDVTDSTHPSVEPLYTGTIDSLVEIPAPEPACVTLVCLSAIGWFARSARRPQACSARVS
jgi:hypothetical protein